MNNLTQDDIQNCLVKALKKIGGTKEKEICKYLPRETGEGYIHHFTLRKLKKNKPADFCSLISEFILNQDSPRLIEPKRRIRRNKNFCITQSDLKKILELAHAAGDDHLLSKLESQMSLTSIKRELIKSIKKNQIDQQLWNAYFHLTNRANLEPVS